MWNYLLLFKLFIIILLTISCNQKPLNNRVSLNNVKNKQPENRLIFEDKIAYQPLDIDQNIFRKYSDFHIFSEVMSNDVDKNQKDTIINFVKKDDSLIVYKVKEKLFLIKMNIATRRIVLKNDIQIGMSKNEFYKRFKQIDTVKNQKNNILIWMTSSQLELYFKSDTLSRIIWNVGDF